MRNATPPRHAAATLTTHASLAAALLLALARCTSVPAGTDAAADLRPGTPGDTGADMTSPPHDPDLTRQYNHLFQQRAGDLGAWTLAGVTVSGSGDAAVAGLTPMRGSPLPCQPGDAGGATVRYDAATGLCAGTDPVAPGGYGKGLNYYNGAAFYFGTLTSPIIHPQEPIDHVIASWDAATPEGTWIEMRVRALIGNAWTRFYVLGIWASELGVVRRHSINGQGDAEGGVDTDTFALRPGALATAYQLGLTLFATTPDRGPSLRGVAALSSRDRDIYPESAPDPAAWGRSLPVPQRSQELAEYRGLGYGGGGEVWCSPTSASMVMAYWGDVLNRADLRRTVPDAAAGTYDHTYAGTGNWPFNTAYAAGAGLNGYVTRLYSLSRAEAWIKSGVPLVISIAYGPGELPGSPISKSTGHLIVLRGFNQAGDVITNNPAAPDNAAVQITYPRAALQAAWSHSQRTAYVIHPPGWQTPAP